MHAFKEALLGYLADNFGVDAEDIEDDTPLFTSNLLDSFGMVDLVAFIESEARIKFDTMDMHLNNLDSVQQILVFVDRKQA